MGKHRPKFLLNKLNHLYHISSHPYSFLFILLTIIGWFAIGYFFHYDEAWYKWFHLYEMCITLLMIFIIETTQQADDRALQEKLDEILRSIPRANNKKIGLEKKYKAME